MEFVGFFLVFIAMAFFVYAAINLVKFLYCLTKLQFKIKNLLLFFASFSLVIVVKLVIDNNTELLHFEVKYPESYVESSKG